MVRYLFYTIGDLTYHSPLVILTTSLQLGLTNVTYEILRCRHSVVEVFALLGCYLALVGIYIIVLKFQQECGRHVLNALYAVQVKLFFSNHKLNFQLWHSLSNISIVSHFRNIYDCSRSRDES